jgi:endonuclease/exonuclease/phosphatase family metal-dependent hydrolase
MFRNIRSESSKKPLANRCRLQVEQLEGRWLPSGADLTVMTYNLYQGSELTPALAAPSPAAIPAAASAVEAELAASNVPARAQAWAKDVAAAHPDVLALQEASLWRIQTPSSTLTGQPTPATTVLYDFVGTLVNDLAARGLHYTVVGTVNGFDAQEPDLAGNDIRLTDRVALLARADEPPGQLSWSNVLSAQYHTNPTVQIGGPSGFPFTIYNGWVSADFTKHGETVRVITTHLDTFVPVINAAQGQELLNGPANTALPVIVMGDFNCPADGSFSTTRHDFLTAGFHDTWSQTHPTDPGYTAMASAYFVNLTNPSFNATQRIDYILTRGGFSADGMKLEGTVAADKTPPSLSAPTGLWPSDHAALVATLDLPRHEFEVDAEACSAHDDGLEGTGPTLRPGEPGDSLCGPLYGPDYAPGGQRRLFVTLPGAAHARAWTFQDLCGLVLVSDSGDASSA